MKKYLKYNVYVKEANGEKLLLEVIRMEKLTSKINFLITNNNTNEMKNKN